jgi:hypothetical protein
MKLPRLALLLTIAFSLIWQKGIAAIILVEGFESPTVLLPRIGDTAQVDATFFSPIVNPPQGNRQLLLTTLAIAADGGNFSGTDAARVADVENFLALSSGAIPVGPTVGDASAVKLTLALHAGDILEFDYRFLTSAGSLDGADFAFFTLRFETDAPLFTVFARTTDASLFSTSANFDLESPLTTFTVPAVNAAGTYTLGFGITDKSNDVIQSGVLIDNVRIVPEPSVVVLLVSAMALWLTRRRVT